MHIESVQSLDVAVFEAVIDNGGTEARSTLARQLATLLAAADTPAGEKEAVLPVMLKLAVDEELAVRRTVADELVTVADLNPDLLFCIVAGEDDLALPFLKATPALSPWHMMAILRVGDESRQCTLASRPDLTAEAAAYIIKSSALPVVLALMDNGAIELEQRDHQILFQRFGQVEAMIERLLMLPNLPPDIRILQAKRAATRMRQLMAERGWLPATDAAELVTDAEDQAVVEVLVSLDPTDLLKAVHFMAGKNMLTPALLIRAACQGEMRVVEAALAHLSGYAPERAAALAYRGGMKSLVAKCGLPPACRGLLVAYAAVVMEAREEGVKLGRQSFGRRLLEALMTRFDDLSPADRAKQISYVGMFAEDAVRKIARQLKSDFQRAA
ncbi:MAG: DUF2336 domain-containing protein [Hyphomicrobiales bacterium]